MAFNETGAARRTEQRDYYSALGAEPSASTAELRNAFRSAVLRYHPDRSPSGALATRRTSILNHVWAVLRDPLRRLHYDRDLESGRGESVEWPLEPGEEPAPSRRAPRSRAHPVAPEVSPWHQPQWRNVAGFRVPTGIWLDGPAAQRRYIVDHYISGEDWRTHRELYWLRYAAEHYRGRGSVEDWLGALERLVELDPSFDTLARAALRDAYVEAREYLRGAAFLHRVGARYEPASAQRGWVDREIRAVLSPFRERLVRRGPMAERAENAELLLNYLEALDLEPAFADLAAAIRAHVRADNGGRALELVDRLTPAGAVDHPRQWFSVVQLLTEAGQLDRASALLASIARGDRPDVLSVTDRSGAQLARRLSTARRRLARARQRTAEANGHADGHRHAQDELVAAET